MLQSLGCLLYALDYLRHCVVFCTVYSCVLRSYGCILCTLFCLEELLFTVQLCVGVLWMLALALFLKALFEKVCQTAGLLYSCMSQSLDLCPMCLVQPEGMHTFMFTVQLSVQSLKGCMP